MTQPCGVTVIHLPKVRGGVRRASPTEEKAGAASFEIAQPEDNGAPRLARTASGSGESASLLQPPRAPPSPTLPQPRRSVLKDVALTQAGATANLYPGDSVCVDRRPAFFLEPRQGDMPGNRYLLTSPGLDPRERDFHDSKRSSIELLSGQLLETPYDPERTLGALRLGRPPHAFLSVEELSSCSAGDWLTASGQAWGVAAVAHRDAPGETRFALLAFDRPWGTPSDTGHVWRGARELCAEGVVLEGPDRILDHERIAQFARPRRLAFCHPQRRVRLRLLCLSASLQGRTPVYTVNTASAGEVLLETLDALGIRSRGGRACIPDGLFVVRLECDIAEPRTSGELSMQLLAGADGSALAPRRLAIDGVEANYVRTLTRAGAFFVHVWTELPVPALCALDPDFVVGPGWTGYLVGCGARLEPPRDWEDMDMALRPEGDWERLARCASGTCFGLGGLPAWTESIAPSGRQLRIAVFLAHPAGRERYRGRRGEVVPRLVSIDTAARTRHAAKLAELEAGLAPGRGEVMALRAVGHPDGGKDIVAFVPHDAKGGGARRLAARSDRAMLHEGTMGKLCLVEDPRRPVLPGELPAQALAPMLVQPHALRPIDAHNRPRPLSPALLLDEKAGVDRRWNALLVRLRRAEGRRETLQPIRIGSVHVVPVREVAAPRGRRHIEFFVEATQPVLALPSLVGRRPAQWNGQSGFFFTLPDPRP